MRENRQPSYLLVSALGRWCSRGRCLLLPLRMSWLNFGREFLLNYYAKKKTASKVIVFPFELIEQNKSTSC